MLFNSFSYAIFLPVVFILYWFVTNNSLKWQNNMLVVASYFFYCCWDWRFGFLLAFSTLLDFYSGLAIERSTTRARKKLWLIISVGINLGFLGFFKYYNFFIESFADMLNMFGMQANYSTLEIILPVGISFYTFHGLSYVFDIYYDRIKPTHDLAVYALFVSFFPLLVAGPIERASHLLPQFFVKRHLKYEKAIDGFFQILWGLFKKVVIADNAAGLVDVIFGSETASGSVRALGAFLFAFQIYCDFSGYSDIALGTAKLFGIDLITNFRYPYFSRDIAEFWRRWHISLSTWFRDYLYIPLGGSKGGMWIRVRNTFIIFIVSGFWHGANWTFIVWGGLNALFIMPLIISNRNRNNIEVVAFNRLIPSFREFFSILLTFTLTMLAWVFFRAESVSKAFIYIKQIFTPSLLSFPKMVSAQNTTMLLVLVMIMVLLITEWYYRKREYVFNDIFSKSLFVQGTIVFILVSLIFFFGGSQADFIYFQF